MVASTLLVIVFDVPVCYPLPDSLRAERSFGRLKVEGFAVIQVGDHALLLVPAGSGRGTGTVVFLQQKANDWRFTACDRDEHDLGIILAQRFYGLRPCWGSAIFQADELLRKKI